MRTSKKVLKRAICLFLIAILNINTFGAIVSDNDGSAFITKAEFDALKSSFQSQIDEYNTSIDSKIDGAIAAYLAGISLTASQEISIYNSFANKTWSMMNSDTYSLAENERAKPNIIAKLYRVGAFTQDKRATYNIFGNITGTSGKEILKETINGVDVILGLYTDFVSNLYWAGISSGSLLIERSTYKWFKFQINDGSLSFPNTSYQFNINKSNASESNTSTALTVAVWSNGLFNHSKSATEDRNSLSFNNINIKAVPLNNENPPIVASTDETTLITGTVEILQSVGSPPSVITNMTKNYIPVQRLGRSSYSSSSVVPPCYKDIIEPENNIIYTFTSGAMLLTVSDNGKIELSLGSSSDMNIAISEGPFSEGFKSISGKYAEINPNNTNSDSDFVDYSDVGYIKLTSEQLKKFRFKAEKNKTYWIKWNNVSEEGDAYITFPLSGKLYYDVD